MRFIGSWFLPERNGPNRAPGVPAPGARAVEVGSSGSPQRCTYETCSGGNRPAAGEPREVDARRCRVVRLFDSGRRGPPMQFSRDEQLRAPTARAIPNRPATEGSPKTPALLS